MKKLVLNLLIMSFLGMFNLLIGYESQFIVEDRNETNETNITVGEPIILRGEGSSESFIKVQISYATNRQRTNSNNVNKYFNEKLGSLQYGQCIVSIPQTHKMGEIERPWWFLGEDPNKHVMIHEILEKNRIAFFEEMKNILSSSDKNDILIFIHGYANSFADSMRRTAQMAHDLQFQGIPMAYSWPASNSGTPLFIKYRKDEKKAKKSVKYLKQFLEEVVSNSNGHKINIIAHSMGNRVLANAINEIELKSGQIFNQVILAAPDINADVFKQHILKNIVNKAEKFTLYASSEDKALIASKIIHNTPRLGEASDTLVVTKEMDTIDASGIDIGMFGLGHAYFSEAGSVINDISQVIRFEVKPDKRNLWSKTKNQIIYWEIK